MTELKLEPPFLGIKDALEDIAPKYCRAWHPGSITFNECINPTCVDIRRVLSESKNSESVAYQKDEPNASWNLPK